MPHTEGSADGREVLVGIRAENMEAATQPSAAALPARVLVVEPLGSHNLLTVQMAGQMMKVTTRTDFEVAPDETIYLEVDPDKVRWFEPESGLPWGQAQEMGRALPA